MFKEGSFQYFLFPTYNHLNPKKNKLCNYVYTIDKTYAIVPFIYLLIHWNDVLVSVMPVSNSFVCLTDSFSQVSNFLIKMNLSIFL